MGNAKDDIAKHKTRKLARETMCALVGPQFNFSQHFDATSPVDADFSNFSSDRLKKDLV